MVTTLPDIGTPVPLPGIDVDRFRELSVGQAAYLMVVAQQNLVDKVSNPAVFHELATYLQASGADWSGFKSDVPTQRTDHSADKSQADTSEQATTSSKYMTDVDGLEEILPPGPVPTPPENDYDAIPHIAEVLRRGQHFNDAIITSFARLIQPAFYNQTEYLGVPEGLKAFENSAGYFLEVLRFSKHTTKRIHDRLDYVTWNPGQDPTLAMNQPALPRIASAFMDGTIPAENLDRLVLMDQDLTKYVHRVGALPAYKNDILQAFEPTLLEAAEASTPDEFSAARRRWADQIAHHIDPDGPPVAQALRKPADNALKDQAYSDGSGRIWIHATPAVYAQYKNFALNQLNKNGAPIKPDDLLTKFLHPPTVDDAHDELGEQPTPRAAHLDDLTIDKDPHATVAADENGTPVTQQELEEIETLSPGQLLGAMVIGLFQNLLTMDPDELQLKKSHGFSAQLTIIQDIETAYKTLGIGALPQEARRPRGAHGVFPTVIKRPNPKKVPRCDNPDHIFGTGPPQGTNFMSEVLNIGAFHPKDAELLSCNSKIVGQIWSNNHTILNQRRAQRTFTAAQRRAILARDRGCQTPGCTIPAVYCQIHHVFPWLLGGHTDIDNATTLCAKHHAAVHNGKWKIVTHHGMLFFQPAPWLDPTEPLLRNLHWAL